MHLAARIALFCAVASSVPAVADEGMWTFDHFPKEAVKERYGVDLSDQWLKHVQRSTTRHESGCSGSFISGDGLVMTNHHCVVECLSDLSSPQQDYVENGYAATTRSEERKCPTEMLSVLMEIEDVTAKVNAATSGLDDAQANVKRKQTLSKLEAACTDAAKNNRQTGPLACESVTLYQGGQYQLYKYKRYDDVRIVFAPHNDIAAFGGDPDNFNFPRWCLDLGMLRVYENGKPAKTPDHLGWRTEGAKVDEPIFVSGHPGTTNRLMTTAQLKFQRDVQFPTTIRRYSELRGRLIQWGKTGEEPLRITQDSLLHIENSLKVYNGLEAALLDDALFERKAKEEQVLREYAVAHPTPSSQIASAWDDVSAAQTRYRDIYARHLFLETAAGFNSSLFTYARQLVRGAAERSKPNEQRLREYADSNLPKIAAGLLGAAPIYPDFEQLKLSYSLDKLREWLGPDDPVVWQLMKSESPDSLAAKAVTGSKLADPALRKQLWDGGSAAVDASQDPMILLAKSVDEQSRSIRKVYEDEVQARVSSGQERIAKARFAALGTGTYPDATFTLRLSYGAVQSWKEAGEHVPEFTRLGRLYERTTGKTPFRLPNVWLDAKTRLDPETPFNFVSTNDIVGGNSGSPVIDAQARVVGLAFDGNIHSLAGNYWYDSRENRMIAVHPQIIITALKDVYGMQGLVSEILKP